MLPSAKSEGFMIGIACALQAARNHREATKSLQLDFSSPILAQVWEDFVAEEADKEADRKERDKRFIFSFCLSHHQDSIEK